MKKLLVLSVVALSSVAFAQDKKEMKGEMKADAKAAHMPHGYTPRKVTKEDKKGIEAMFKAMEAAEMKGDMNAAMEHIDFPVYMMTDNSQGKVMSDSWTKEKYAKMMTDAMAQMPKDHAMKPPKHNFKYFFLTDTMAIVTDQKTMHMGKEKMPVRSAMTVIQKDGKWMVKTMAEGGWGDSMGTGGSGEMK
jgi:hypothetical protein